MNITCQLLIVFLLTLYIKCDNQNQRCYRISAVNQYEFCQFCIQKEQEGQSQNKYSCSAYIGEEEIKQLKLKECRRYCCSSKFEEYGIKQCQNQQSIQQQEQNTQALSYYFIMSSSLFGFCFLIICFGCCRRFIAQRRAVNNNQRTVPQQQAYNENSQASLDFYKKNNMIKTHQFPKKLNDDCINMEKDICCICLEENINTITSCSHNFHLQCLKAWFNKKNTCPLCNSLGIYLVNFYCIECRNPICEINMREIWRMPPNLYCGSCGTQYNR